MKRRQYNGFSILFLFILSAFIMYKQLIVLGYFCVHIEDAYAFTSRGWQFVEALKEGIIYPRWAPLNFWGYGSPAFILYPPLAYYIVAFFNVFTGSVISAMNMTKFLSLFLYGVGMFFLTREFYSERVALLTASFSIIFPYTIFQFYLVGTFYAIVSIMWFAPIILFTYRYMKERHSKNVIYAGLCYGGLILTHLINAYMFTLVLGAFILYMSIISRRWRDVMLIPLIMGIGFLISSAYTVPIIFENQYVHMKAFVGEGIESGFLSDFRNFFILPDMTSKFSPDHLWHRLYHIFVFHVFLLCLLIALYFSQVLKIKNVPTMKNANYINKFFLGTALFTIFLLFGISTFIWDAIPFFKYIQFSHRWLNITTFTAGFLASVVFWGIGTIHKTKKERVALFVIMFLICTISFSLDYKYMKVSPVTKEQDLIPIKPPNWYKVDLPASVDISTIDKNDISGEKVIITKGVGKIAVSKWGSADRIIDTVAHQPITVRVRTFNFPGWKARIDNKQAEIKTEVGTGAMIIDIPEGEHRIEITFMDTPIRYYSKIISLVSFVIIVFLVLLPKRTKNNNLLL